MRLTSRGGTHLPRYDIFPSARRQAEATPGAFEDAEIEAFMRGIEALDPSLTAAQVRTMYERRKEYHLLFEPLARCDRILKDAYRARRGPRRESIARLIREIEAQGGPAGLLPGLKRRLIQCEEP